MFSLKGGKFIFSKTNYVEWKRRATKPLGIAHSDVRDPVKTISIGGARYFMNVINDFSMKV